MHGDVLLDLGEVLQVAGSADEATEAAQNAARLYRKKGNAVSANKADMFLKELGDVRAAGEGAS
jgi:hypothetical protein